jgi:O-antigen/teichoic acid export membrane protein
MNSTPLSGLNLSTSGVRPILLAAMTLGGHSLMYLASLFLAHSLSLREFDNYSVASAVIAILSTCSTLGLEKYALRAIPLFHDRSDWQKLNGYILFSVKAISLFSVIIGGLLTTSILAFLSLKQIVYHLAIICFAGYSKCFVFIGVDFCRID